MKTSLECMACFLNQSLRVARLQNCSESQQREVVLAVAELLPALNLEQTPPENAIPIYAKISEITGCADPYKEIKRIENTKALAHLSALKSELELSASPLLSAIGFAIAGNIIDYGAADRFDIEATFEKSRDIAFAIDHREQLFSSITALKPGASILYLADNCGEIVYDSLVIEILAKTGCNVTVAVRGLPIINDALIEDAIDAGLDKYARIIPNGIACPGTPVSECTDELKTLFNESDLVISKGQGNFETLSEVDREVFFLLTVKCKVVGNHLTKMSDNECSLSGNGEMVVYHSRQKNT